MLVLATEDVLGVVEIRALEPARAGHHALAQDLVVRRIRDDLEVLPERAPELLDLCDRPAPELVVVGEVEVAVLRQPAHVGGELGALDHLWRGRPENLCLGGSLLHSTDPYTRSAAGAGGCGAAADPARRPASRSISRASETRKLVAWVRATESTRSGMSSCVWYQGARLPSGAVVRSVIARLRRTRAGIASSSRGWRIGRAPSGPAAPESESASQSSIICGSWGRLITGPWLTSYAACPKETESTLTKAVLARSNSLRRLRTNALLPSQKDSSEPARTIQTSRFSGGLAASSSAAERTAATPEALSYAPGTMSDRAMSMSR